MNKITAAALIKPSIWLPPTIMSVLLLFLAEVNFLAFHTLAEFFPVVFMYIMFVTVWWMRKYAPNGFILFIAIGYLGVASLDLIHTLVYVGLDVFVEGSANLSTQFWVSARFLEALILLSVPFVVNRKLNEYALISLIVMLVIIVSVLIFSGNFPVGYSAGVGLTNFKIYSEYIIISLLMLSLLALYFKGAGKTFEGTPLIAAAITLTIASEFLFTFYVNVYDFANLAGHIVKIFSIWMVFQSVAVYNMKKPLAEMVRLEQYNRSMFENAVTGMALCKMDGSFVDVNPAFAKLTGYSVQELVEMDYWEITPLSYSEIERQQLDSVNVSGNYGPYRKEYISKNGDLIPVSLSGVVVYSEGERFILSSVVDISERKLLEKAKAGLEFQQYALDEHAIVSMADKSGNITYVNDKLCEVTGYAREELVGKNHRIFKSGKHPDELYKQLWSTITSGKTWNGEVKNKKKDGGYYWALSTVVPIIGDDGKPKGYVAIRSDITNRKIAEKAARQLKYTLDLSKDEITMFWADNFEFYYANEAVALRTGVDVKDLIGRTIKTVNPMFDEKKFRERAAPLIRGEKASLTYETSIQNNSGEIVDREMVLQLVRSEDRRLRFISIGRDISSRAKLRQANEELTFQINALDEHAIVSVTDVKGNITYVNDKLCEISGFSREELIGQNHRLLKSDEHTKSFFKEAWRTIASGKPWHGEIKNFKKNGEQYWVLATIYPQLNVEGKPVKYISIRTDISARKEVEEKIRKFKNTLDFTTDEVYMVSVNTLEILYANEAAVKRSGVSENIIAGSILLDRYTKAEKATFNRLVKPLLSGELPSVTVEVDRPDVKNNLRPIESLIQVFELDTDDPYYVIIGRDVSERKEAEQAIERFKKALDFADDKVTFFTADTLEITYVNQSVCKLMEMSSEAMIGLKMSDANPLFRNDVFLERVAPLLSGEIDSISYESKVTNGEGVVVPLDISLQINTDSAGKRFFTSIARDISGRKGAERKILRFKNSLDLTEDEVYMMWPDTFELFYVNQAAASTLGKQSEAFYGKTPSFFNPDFNFGEFNKRVEPLQNDAVSSVLYETTHLNVHGEMYPCEAHVQFITIADERPYYVIICRNLTDQKAAETSIRMFKTTLDLTEDEVYMFKPGSLKFFYVNKSAKKQLGWSDEEFAEMTPLDIKPEIGEKEFHNIIDGLMSETKGRVIFETVHMRRNGSRLPVEVQLQYLTPTDEAPRFVAVVKDITERLKVDRAKSEFISTVSHELRTPLTSIKGVLGLIKAGAFNRSPEKLLPMVEIAYDNSNRLGSLIDDILDIEKITAGKMELVLKPLNASILIEEALDANKAYGDKYGVKFVYQMTDNRLIMHGDKDRLMQVMSNLLSNAAKFSEDGTVVEITATHQNDSIYISVKDCGSGIPEEAQATIFERFTQADSSDQREKGGTGLGLSISKTIIDGHGGNIGFTSKDGQGTNFYFEIPSTFPAQGAQ